MSLQITLLLVKTLYPICGADQGRNERAMEVANPFLLNIQREKPSHEDEKLLIHNLNHFVL